MATTFCLPAKIADELKKRAVAGEIDIAKMYEMTSAKRNALFKKWVDTDTAQKINGEFEKAMVSNRKEALAEWADKTFTGKKNEPLKRDIYTKIERLNELGLLSPSSSDAYLSDLVATQLGATVTAEEAATLSGYSDELIELAKKESKFGTPTLEYFKKRKEVENYMESLNPASRLKVATSVIGRGSMLFSLKSPTLNIESNTIQALLTAAERRWSSARLGGANGDYAKEYRRFVNEVYDKTGYDISRMRNLTGPQRIRGESITTTQGKGTVRAIGRLYEDIVFNKLMGKPDVIFSAIHNADSSNLTSTMIADMEGLKGAEQKARALEIFKDSTRLNPTTEAGIKVRDQAIADAEYATYTNDSKYSEVALGIRKILNIASGDLRLGDQMMPFVKTPANVIGAGLDYSGVLIPIDTMMRTAKIIKSIRAGDTVKDSVLDNMDGYLRKLFRAGLGITMAYVIAGLFEPDEFIGEYPTSQKEQELLRLNNATTNSVKIGDRWISLDYFGALGAPLVAMLYAKKYGKTKGGAVYNYYIGAARQVSKIPGLEIGKDLFETLSRTKFGGASEITGELKKGSIDYIRSRTVPAFVYDIAKMTDKYERQIDKNKPWESLMNVIPYVRQGLPVKKNVLGQEVKTEPAFSTLFLGSRVKTVNNDKVVGELNRLLEVGQLPSITNYASTSPSFKELKKQIGDKRFIEAEAYLANRIYSKFDTIMNSGAYKKLPDEKKTKILNSEKQKALEVTLVKFGYKKPQ